VWPQQKPPPSHSGGAAFTFLVTGAPKMADFSPFRYPWRFPSAASEAGLKQYQCVSSSRPLRAYKSSDLLTSGDH
jgi:hypothetical protein